MAGKEADDKTRQLTFPVGLFRRKNPQDVYTPATMGSLQDDFRGDANFLTDSLISTCQQNSHLLLCGMTCDVG